MLSRAARVSQLPSPTWRCCSRSPTSADRRARAGRSLIGNPWVYTLSLGVYCTAWTYYGSVGRAATSGLWFLPIYLGPTLAMLLAWIVLRKMVRIARSAPHHLDRRLHRHPLRQEPAAGGLVTLIAVVGILPYIALQLKAVASGYALLTGAPGAAGAAAGLVARQHAVRSRWCWPPSPSPSARATSTPPSATRAWSPRSPFESLVKLLAFLAVGAFVTWGLFDGPADLFAPRRGAARTGTRCSTSSAAAPAAASPAASGSR